MSLIDPMFMTAGGEPVAGRTPAPLRLVSGRMTPALQAEATRIYNDFCTTKRLSVAPYHKATYILSDGARVDCVSNNGVDVVYVWPRAPAADLVLPHGLAVVVPWCRPFIYARDKESRWKVQGDAVPQLSTPVVAYGGTEALHEGRIHANPLVKAAKVIWSQVRRPSPESGALVTVPVNLRAPGDDTPHEVAAHYAVDDKIKDGGASERYVVASVPHIRLDESDGITFFPADTDTVGAIVAFSARRFAFITETAAVSRHLTEVVERTPPVESELGYKRNARTTGDVVCTNTANTAITELSVAYAYLASPDGQRIDANVTVNRYFTNTGGGSYSMNIQLFYALALPPQLIWAGPSVFAIFGVKQQDPGISEDWKTRTHNAYTRILRQAAAETSTLDTAFRLPAASGVTPVLLRLQLSYPTREFFRAGSSECTWNRFAIYPGEFPPRYYMDTQQRLGRANCQFQQTGRPSITLDTEWLQLKLLDGTTEGKLVGKYEEDVNSRATNIDSEFAFAAVGFDSYVDIRVERLSPPEDIPALTYTGFNIVPGILGARRPDFYLGIIEKYTGTKVENRVIEAAVNTCTYIYTSRYIIDYDHRGRFCAWIRIDVNCSGLERNDGGSEYRGFLTTKKNPTYTVRIYFESRWKDVSHSQLLHESSGERPGFEFTRAFRDNVFYYQLPQELTHRHEFFLPPTLGLRPEIVKNLDALFKHQGVNTNLATEYVQPDAPPDQTSDTGIEFTEFRDTDEGQARRFYRRRFAGMLYARTFRLADIPEALWLLTATKCDATLNNAGEGLSYYYMPALREFINAETEAGIIHIELRDGLPVTWTDLTPDPSTRRPPLKQRTDIKLYRV